MLENGNYTIKVENDMLCGVAGEYLVCADLILQGHRACLSGQGLHYDIIVDVNNELFRIQVKTTRGVKTSLYHKNYIPMYFFHARRCGGKGRYSYLNNDFDIMAFVTLDRRDIWYLSIYDVGQTMSFRLRENANLYKRNGRRSDNYYDGLTFDKALESLKTQRKN